MFFTVFILHSDSCKSLYINIVTHRSRACICIFAGLEVGTNFTRHYIIKKNCFSITRYTIIVIPFGSYCSLLKKKNNTHIFLILLLIGIFLHRPCYSFNGLCYISLSVYKSYTTKKKQIFASNRTD